MHSRPFCRDCLFVALLVGLAPSGSGAKEAADYSGLSLTEAARLIREGRISRTELVEALLDAGAIVMGKTNMHELAFGATSNNATFGPVRNPYDRARFPGGSSGGTAAAIAAGIAPAGLGTDTVGLLARSVADVVLLDQVITADLSPAQPADLKKIRLGATIGYFEAKADLTAYLAKYQPQLTLTDLAASIASPDVKDLFDKNLLGEKAPAAAAYQEAMQEVRPKLQQMYAGAFVDYKIDALIFPTTPMPAQPLESSATEARTKWRYCA